MKEILREIGTIYRCLDSISNIEFKRFELSKGQYAYLARIHENPGIILERVSEMLKIDRATASRAIQKLELSGLIEKLDDPVNKRIQRLFTTHQGAKLYEIIDAEEKYSNATALRGLSKTDQDRLLCLLKKVHENLDSEWSFTKNGGQRPYLDKYENLP